MKQVIFSGIKATGILHLGNYIGAVRNWIKLQDQYHCYYSIVDLHSITIRQSPQDMRRRSLSNLMLYISCGLDPDKSALFFQNQVPAHAQLAWLLNCYTYFGELSRMTQFKDMSKKHPENINAGLFTYPVLMAADILLYNANLVPVGEDQKQHVEITRDIALRFNAIYGDIFTIPDVYMPKVGARVMDLQNPESKMNKDSPHGDAGCVYLLDTPDVIMKKFKRAVTDSDSCVKYGEGKHGVNNLIAVYSAMTGETIQDIECAFEGKGYGDFKKAVAEAVIEGLRPIREKYCDLEKNLDYVKKIYTDGAQKASAVADATLARVYDVVGFA